MEFSEVKIEVFIPEEYLLALRDELNLVGACHVGRYDNCISVSRVSGYWRPLEGANPYGGTVGEISHGEEAKAEVRCRRELVGQALKVIRRIHPYEEPVINVIALVNDMFD